jgi:hypothetical protein
MKLIDLDPRWLVDQSGRRIGFIFISPKQMMRHDGTTNPTQWRQTCFVAATSLHDQELAVWKAMADLAGNDGEFDFFQACNQSSGWKIAGGIENASFETMSVTPSIDGSAGGLWHGFITNGLIY